MRTFLCLLLLAAPVVHAQAVLVDRIVATIDSRAITRSELDARAERDKASRAGGAATPKALRDAALDQLIDEYLIAKDAIAKSVSLTDDEVDKAIQMVMEQNKLSKGDFELAIVAQGYTLEAYRTAIGVQLLELKWLSLRTSSMEKPTDDAARTKFFADQKKRFVSELRAKASIEVRP